MKVNSTGKVVRFYEVPEGGVFKFSDNTFLKIEPLEPKGKDFPINAVSLDGELTVEFMQNDFVVYYPNANLNLV